MVEIKIATSRGHGSNVFEVTESIEHFYAAEGMSVSMCSLKAAPRLLLSISPRRTFMRVFASVVCFLFAAACLEAQQTIFWKKDHVYNGPGGKEIATITPAPSDQTAPTAPTGLRMELSFTRTAPRSARTNAAPTSRPKSSCKCESPVWKARRR